ncbi:HNH endonuclease signature motif containing protein [Mycobacterium heidelbergense]|uniref:HNH endonuclease signature motif containing protein n=1 Tax=Mycobacterium heidelbergense TaxID=53376 RepID=UPI003CF3C087
MFDTRLHDYWEPSDTGESRALIDRMCAAWRTEARAVADRLDAIGELFELRRAERGEHQDWAVDTWAAVGAEVAAAFRISLAMAGSYLRYALAMRERLPLVAEVFRAGDIDYQLFQTMVYRTDLITDPDVLARVDGELAVRAPRWPSMTQGKLAGAVDRIVAAADRDAVRRHRDRMRDREVSIWESERGMSELHGSLFASDAEALDKRLDALAATVCAADPRSKDQRRADALGALAAGLEALGCQCGSSDCVAGGRAAPGPVVIHVVAEQATVEGRGTNPGSLLGADGLISAELVVELAKTARLQPLLPPGGAEPHYTPSAKLAAFARARDLTCRAPGCDRPATECDLDHTIPFADGGATHASNIKCLCRFHHLLKTFWGWRDQQLRDGTVIWSMPDGHTYVTTPGSALLFPALCAPTGSVPTPDRADLDRRGDRTAMMPLRATTRAQNRAHRVNADRERNYRNRQPRPPVSVGAQEIDYVPTDPDPPPF